MAREQQWMKLTEGASAWNRWREENPGIRPELSNISFRAASERTIGADLAGANFSSADLSGADFYRSWLVGANFEGAELSDGILGQATLGGASFANANLRETNFMQAHLFRADFSGAHLRGAKFAGANLHEAKMTGLELVGQWFANADLSGADLAGADLRGANLQGVNLLGANLGGANLSEADLQGARLIRTDIEGANFQDALVHGISVWMINGKPNNQQGLVVSNAEEARVTVDELEVAQFIYLLLTRDKLRQVIATITSKVVLILGRFTPDRKAVLDALADHLRHLNLLPIIFDFERAASRDFTETIKTLAGMSFFVIADITNPKSAPLELQATVPDYQIPFVPIIQEGEEPFSMFRDLRSKYDWVLDPVAYGSPDKLLKAFKRAILDRAWEKHRQLQRKKTAEVDVLSVEQFLDESSAGEE